MTTSRPHLFISYSRHDLDFARYLRALLEAEGLRVWQDEARLNPGEDWWQTITHSIDGCCALVIIMTPDAQTSRWVQRELLYAEKLGRPIFPVLLSGEVWSRLADLQYEDLRAGLRAKLSPRFVRALHATLPTLPDRQVTFTIQHGDVLAWACDVVVFKYAQQFHGADMGAVMTLAAHGVAREALQPPLGEYRHTATHGALGAPDALFIGTPRLRQIGYNHLREFSQRALSAASATLPAARHMAMTIHGPGFGLDETEALLSQFAGLKDMLDAGDVPPALEQITIVEFSRERVRRMREALTPHLQQLTDARPMPDDWRYPLAVGGQAIPSPVLTALDQAGSRPRVNAYVALPAQGDYEDFFYYGVQTPVHSFGLLCERVDGSEVGQEVWEQMRARLDSAAVVIAEVSQADALLHLQIGYALGRGCPVICLRRSEGDSGPAVPLPRLLYHKIRDVEALLSDQLAGLKASGALG